MSFPGSGNWGSDFLSLLPIAAESVAGPEQVGGFGLRFDGSLVNIWWNGATTSCKLIGDVGVDGVLTHFELVGVPKYCSHVATFLQGPSSHILLAVLPLWIEVRSQHRRSASWSVCVMPAMTTLWPALTGLGGLCDFS